MRECLLFRVAAIIILVGTLAAIGLGQECRVSSILRVLDRRGQPVANVTPSQVKVELNASQANVSSFSPAAKPAVVLMLDASGSMRGAWKESIAAARELLNNAGEDVAVFVFDEKIRDQAIGHTNSQRLLDRWSSDSPRYRTALFDALIEIARRGGPGNAAIVVITDGEDDASTHSSEGTKSLFLRSSWPPVFGLVVDYIHGGSDYRDSHLKKISVSTGGFVSYPPSESEVQEAMEKLEAAVFSAFTMTLQPSQSITPGAKLKLIHGLHALYPVEVAGCDGSSGARTRK